MKSYPSPYTRNTSYSSDCQLFSSLCKEKVIEFENSGIKSKFDFDRKTAHKWSCAGQCKIASDYLKDWGKATSLRWEYEKENKKGNWCYLKVRESSFQVFKGYLEDIGYVVGNEYK